MFEADVPAPEEPMTVSGSEPGDSSIAEPVGWCGDGETETESTSVAEVVTIDVSPGEEDWQGAAELVMAPPTTLGGEMGSWSPTLVSSLVDTVSAEVESVAALESLEELDASLTRVKTEGMHLLMCAAGRAVVLGAILHRVFKVVRRRGETWRGYLKKRNLDARTVRRWRQYAKSFLGADPEGRVQLLQVGLSKGLAQLAADSGKEPPTAQEGSQEATTADDDSETGSAEVDDRKGASTSEPTSGAEELGLNDPTPTPDHQGNAENANAGVQERAQIQDPTTADDQAGEPGDVEHDRCDCSADEDREPDVDRGSTTNDHAGTSTGSGRELDFEVDGALQRLADNLAQGIELLGPASCQIRELPSTISPSTANEFRGRVVRFCEKIIGLRHQLWELVAELNRAM